MNTKYSGILRVPIPNTSKSKAVVVNVCTRPWQKEFRCIPSGISPVIFMFHTVNGIAISVFGLKLIEIYYKAKYKLFV